MQERNRWQVAHFLVFAGGPSAHWGEYEIASAALEGDHQAYLHNPYKKKEIVTPVETPSVRYLDVVTAMNGGPHAEGKFRNVRARAGEHFYLAAQAIQEHLEALPANHPDRAVYERGLNAVQEKNAALAVPIRVPG